ncbi:serine/threonine protein kinase [Cystobacter fuscus]|uniref:Serine/threonine protein kinase n=2 Tax=Cystobacter fuscus TaxID=43 RepID=A0A250J566_9BACT|nr:serine/threonine protein kinase [Cystobacter fuscus]ATB38647.1 serine/threonine protein kinase [Cystobacter fuscus]
MISTKTKRLRLLVLLSSSGLACSASGGSLRPDGSPGPQECSEKALETMKILRLRPGEAAFMEIDANQVDQSPISLTDGPIESYTTERLGTLPSMTRLYGRVWTTGPNVVIRYYEARPPDGEPIAICGVARDDRGGLKKRPDSPPGVALLTNSGAAMWIVDSFR